MKYVQFKYKTTDTTYMTMNAVNANTALVTQGVWIDYDNPDIGSPGKARRISTFIPYDSLLFLHKWEIDDNG